MASARKVFEMVGSGLRQFFTPSYVKSTSTVDKDMKDSPDKTLEKQKDEINKDLSCQQESVVFPVIPHKDEHFVHANGTSDTLYAHEINQNNPSIMPASLNKTERCLPEQNYTHLSGTTTHTQHGNHRLNDSSSKINTKSMEIHALEQNMFDSERNMSQQHFKSEENVLVSSVANVKNDVHISKQNHNQVTSKYGGERREIPENNPFNFVNGASFTSPELEFYNRCNQNKIQMNKIPETTTFSAINCAEPNCTQREIIPNVASKNQSTESTKNASFPFQNTTSQNLINNEMDCYKMDQQCNGYGYKYQNENNQPGYKSERGQNHYNFSNQAENNQHGYINCHESSYGKNEIHNQNNHPGNSNQSHGQNGWLYLTQNKGYTNANIYNPNSYPERVEYNQNGHTIQPNSVNSTNQSLNNSCYENQRYNRQGYLDDRQCSQSPAQYNHYGYSQSRDILRNASSCDDCEGNRHNNQNGYANNTPYGTTSTPQETMYIHNCNICPNSQYGFQNELNGYKTSPKTNTRENYGPFNTNPNNQYGYSNRSPQENDRFSHANPNNTYENMYKNNHSGYNPMSTDDKHCLPPRMTNNHHGYGSPMENDRNYNHKPLEIERGHCMPDRVPYGDSTHDTGFKSRRKEKEPDTYCGTKTEWQDHICHFEQVALWNGWTESEKASQLAICLRGNAQRVLSELTPAELSDYQRLKSALAQRFNPPERETAHRCEFRSRRRNRGESAADYGYALKRLASLAFPQIPMDTRESLVIEQYVSGLGDQELKRYVQFSHPSTLNKAISLAVEFEAFEGSQNTNFRKPKPDETASVQAVNRVQDMNLKQDPSLHELAETVKSMQQTIRNMNKPTPTMTKENHRATHPGMQRDMKNTQCYTCKNFGHLSRDCPTKDNVGQDRHFQNRKSGQNKPDTTVTLK